MTIPDGPPPRTSRPGVRIGVDVGSARVGVAASDPSGTFAHPVQTLPRDEQHGTDLDSLTALVVERAAIEVVVGLPLLLSGQEGEAASPAGALDERAVVLETLTSIRRAGADIIISYHAKDAALWIK